MTTDVHGPHGRPRPRTACPECQGAPHGAHAPDCTLDPTRCGTCHIEYDVLPWLCPHGMMTRSAQGLPVR